MFQAVVALAGLAVLAFLLIEPHLEGRNAHATLFEIYGQDPFLAYVYAGSVPFFVAVGRAFGLFGAVRKTGTFSPATVVALQGIRRCAMAVLGFVAGGVVLILIFGDRDDRPAGFFMGFLVAVAAGVVAAGAATAARKLQDTLRRSDGGRS